MANTALHCNEMPPQQDTTAITARNNENSKNNARFVLSHDKGPITCIYPIYSIK